VNFRRTAPQISGGTNILDAAFPVIAGSAFTQFDPHFEEVRGCRTLVDGSLESLCTTSYSSWLNFFSLALTIDAQQGKNVSKLLLSGGAGKFEPTYQANGATPCQYIDTNRKAIDCDATLPLTIFMAALCNRCGHYILPCDFYLLLSSSFFFFPPLISAVGDWMSTILPHMVWP